MDVTVNVSKYTRILWERRKPMFLFGEAVGHCGLRHTKKIWSVACQIQKVRILIDSLGEWRKMSVSRSRKISTYLRLCPPKLHRETNITNLFLWSLNKQWMCSTLLSTMFAQQTKALGGGGPFITAVWEWPSPSFPSSSTNFTAVIRGDLPLFPWWRIASVLWFGPLFYRWGKRNLATDHGQFWRSWSFFFEWPWFDHDVVVSTSEILLII